MNERRFIHHTDRPKATAEQITMWKTIGQRLSAAREAYAQSPHSADWQAMSEADWHTVTATDADAVEEFIHQLFHQTEEICQEAGQDHHGLTPDAFFFPHLDVMRELGDIYWDHAEGFRDHYPRGATKDFQRVLVLTHDLPRALGFNGGVPINKGDDAIHALVGAYFPNLPLKHYMPDAAVMWSEGAYPSDVIVNFWKLADTCGKPANGGIRYPEAFLAPGGGHEEWQRRAIAREAFPLYLPDGRTYTTEADGTTRFSGGQHGYWAVSGEYYGQRDREWTMQAYRMVSEQFPDVNFNTALEQAVHKVSG